MRRPLPCSAALALIALALFALVRIGSSAAGQGEPKKPPVAPDGDFRGKVLMIFSRIPQQGGVLENVQLKPLGMRFFLAGKPGGGDAKAPTIWLAVDDITMISVFNSLEDAKKAYNEARKAQEDR
jgi:hypothetical protein